MVISILKKCHIYWNSLRTRSQVDQAGEDIKKLITTIADNYL